MKALRAHEIPMNATVKEPRHRSNLLRRHWLTAAFVISLMTLASYTWVLFYQAEVKLAQARSSRGELEERLTEARLTSGQLQQELTLAKDDAHMELKAKSMGFVYPQETVFQSSKR